ncbi:hypothetical protein F4808DRAFT_409837 [Astrocystis sublimbata]|nr:hypothetical protein F4808DRAFT_409837 [Astrocystis sublimbata]
MMGDPETHPEKHHIDDDGEHHDNDGPDDGSQGSTRKRQRVRLSCLECRRRKLSCSRELPCDRCIKSGTAEKCTYESRPGRASAPIVTAAARSTFIPTESPFVTYGSESHRISSSNQHTARHSADSHGLKESGRDHDRIRRLEFEVAQLRSALAKQSPADGSTIVASPATTRDASKDTPPSHWAQAGASFADPDVVSRVKYADNVTCFRGRYIGPHNIWSSLKSITGIGDFMKETADEWLRPLNIQKKDRGRRRQDREMKAAEPDPALEALLPSREETDSLVRVYLDQFEQLHRIVHIPVFRKEYGLFWDPAHTNPASFTALILSMISVSCCLGMQTSGKFIGVKSSSYAQAEKWVKACDKWVSQQSHKHRGLVHYQIECLLYLAKRVNILKKKRFWITAGMRIREAVTIGLHQDPDTISPDVSPYNKEMRRRIWSTLVEFDLQASFDFGVPTLLGQVHFNVQAPRNIDDDSFDQDSTELPPSRPQSEYTSSSYAHISRQSIPARLELYKVLNGPPVDLDWEQVLQYTDMITREIDALPAWDLESDNQAEGGSQKPSLAYTLLHIQLRQFLIPLHQPFLKLRKFHSRYQMSEFIYYNAARDLVLMHDRLFQKGIRTLYFLREDSMSAAMNLCNVTLLQPRGSSSLININSKESLSLVEKCIALREDRVLRCGNNDPWGYSSMCAAYGLMETHLGLKSPEDAKAQAAQRFIALHYKLLSYQVSLGGQLETQNDSIAQPPSSAPTAFTPMNVYTNSTPLATAQLGPTSMHREGLPLSIPWSMPPIDPSQLLVPNQDLNFDLLGSDLNELWGDWGNADSV